MSDEQEAFPAYAALLGLTDQYGGVAQFEALLEQVIHMETDTRALLGKGAILSVRGKRTLYETVATRNFASNAQEAFAAANFGDMRAAETAAGMAVQYRQSFFDLFNHGFDPRSGRRA